MLKTAKKKIIPKTDKYRIGGQSIADAFIKVRISTAEVGNKATLTFIWIKIINLKAYNKVPDDELKMTLTQKRSEYHMGVKEIMPEKFIQYYYNCYHIRTTNVINPWMKKIKKISNWKQ